MMSGIFPRHIIEHFSSQATAVPEHMGQLARSHENVTILFMDIVGESLEPSVGPTDNFILPTDEVQCKRPGFTSMAKEVEPKAVMTFLNKLFTLFDQICDVHGVQKVETAGEARDGWLRVRGGIDEWLGEVLFQSLRFSTCQFTACPPSGGCTSDLVHTSTSGDCYVACCGILSADDSGFFSVNGEHDARQSARRVMAFAREMMTVSERVVMPHNGQPVQIRIGLHTGPCVSVGIRGFKLDHA